MEILPFHSSQAQNDVVSRDLCKPVVQVDGSVSCPIISHFFLQLLYDGAASAALDAAKAIQPSVSLLRSMADVALILRMIMLRNVRAKGAMCKAGLMRAVLAAWPAATAGAAGSNPRLLRELLGCLLNSLTDCYDAHAAFLGGSSRPSSKSLLSRVQVILEGKEDDTIFPLACAVVGALAWSKSGSGVLLRNNSLQKLAQRVPSFVKARNEDGLLPTLHVLVNATFCTNGATALLRVSGFLDTLLDIIEARGPGLMVAAALLRNLCYVPGNQV